MAPATVFSCSVRSRGIPLVVPLVSSIYTVNPLLKDIPGNPCMFHSVHTEKYAEEDVT